MTHYLFAVEWRGSMNRKSLRIFHTFEEIISHIHSSYETAKSVYSGFYRVYEITDDKSKNINKTFNTLLCIGGDYRKVIVDGILPDNEYTRSMEQGDRNA